MESVPRNAEPAISLQLVTELDAVKPIWLKFQQDADCTVFQTFDWLREWHRHVGEQKGIRPVIVMARDSAGEPLMVLPLAIERHGMVRRLVWLGTELNDYNAPLLTVTFASQVTDQRFTALWQEILSLIRQHPHLGFDIVEFEKMPEFVGSQRNPFVALPVLNEACSAHMATLGSCWDNFYAATQSPAARRRDRWKFKQLSKGGEISFVHVQDEEAIRTTLELLIALKRQSLARIGAKDLFADARYHAFYHAVVGNSGLRDMIHLSRLDVGGVTAAIGLGLQFGSCYYFVLQSYRNDALAKFSPGRMLIRERIRYAIGRQASRIDFTIGDEPYKHDWCDTEMRLLKHVKATAPRGRPVAAIKTALHRGELFVLERPMLRSLLSRVRRALSQTEATRRAQAHSAG